MTYEAWRCTFQSAEAAARAAYGQVQGAVAEAAGLREKLEARCPGLVQIQEPAETAAPVVLPEPVTWLVERSAFRVSPHGQDAESCEWLEEAHEPGEKGSFAVYTGPQVRALLAATCSLVQEVYVEFIKDGMGGDFEDGEHPLADRVRAFLAGAAVPAAPEHPAQGVPAPAALDRDALVDLIAEGLKGTYYCNRSWSAWHVGTMQSSDFYEVDESDIPDELADSVLSMFASALQAQAEDALTDDEAAELILETQTMHCEKDAWHVAVEVHRVLKAHYDAAIAAPTQTEDARDAEIALPKMRNAVRIGDIHPKDHIHLEFGFQNDVYVSIRDGYNYASIEFRKPGGDYSGRRSIRTYAALIALSVAMEADNATNPSSNPWAQNDEIAAQAAKGETQ